MKSQKFGWRFTLVLLISFVPFFTYAKNDIITWSAHYKPTLMAVGDANYMMRKIRPGEYKISIKNNSNKHTENFELVVSKEVISTRDCIDIIDHSMKAGRNSWLHNDTRYYHISKESNLDILLEEGDFIHIFPRTYYEYMNNWVLNQSRVGELVMELR